MIFPTLLPPKFSKQKSEEKLYEITLIFLQYQYPYSFPHWSSFLLYFHCIHEKRSNIICNQNCEREHKKYIPGKICQQQIYQEKKKKTRKPGERKNFIENQNP